MIHVNGGHLQTCASAAFGKVLQRPAVFGVFWCVDGRVAVKDRVLDPVFSCTIELVVEDYGRIGVTGFYFVCVDSFAGDEFRFAFAIQVGKDQRVDL